MPVSFHDSKVRMFSLNTSHPNTPGVSSQCTERGMDGRKLGGQLCFISLLFSLQGL